MLKQEEVKATVLKGERLKLTLIVMSQVNSEVFSYTTNQIFKTKLRQRKPKSQQLRKRLSLWIKEKLIKYKHLFVLSKLMPLKIN